MQVMNQTNKKTAFRRFSPPLLAVLFAAMLFFLSAGRIQAVEIPNVSPYAKTIRNYDKAYEAMYLAMYNVEEGKIDLSSYRLTKSEVLQIYSDVRYNSPELFYIDTKRLIYYVNPYDVSGHDYVLAVQFPYLMTGDELTEAKARYEAEIDYIASLISEDMTDLEIALFVHDYFVSSFSYDDSMTNYDAYTLFTSRTGVCQAYSLAYAAVLRECGIPAVMVTSDEMNHAWNLVQLNGSWYHVDLVHDDPSPDRMGMVLHENFLLSDAAVRETHKGWTSAIHCQSTLYDNAYWSDISSRMAYINGLWYYLDSEKNAVVASSYTGLIREPVYTFSDRWYVRDSTVSFWKGLFSGCAEYQTDLYFNTPDEILVYNTETGALSTLIQNDSEDTDFYGLTIYKNTLEYLSADEPDAPLHSELHIYRLTDFGENHSADGLPFTDVPRFSKYYPAVRFVYKNELFTGVSQTEFDLSGTMTRAMFVTVLGRMCGIDPMDFPGAPFEDVSTKTWYSPYVQWAVKNGIVNGIGDNRFDPEGSITHEQMYKILYDCARYLQCPDTEHAALLYVDRRQVSDWARDGVAYCRDLGIISKDFSAYLKPQKNATRAEVAELVYHFVATVFGESFPLHMA